MPPHYLLGPVPPDQARRWQADRDEKRFADLVISTASAISTRRRIE